MRTEQALLVGAIGLAAYFFFKGKIAGFTTGISSSIPSGGTTPSVPKTKYGISSKGLSYNDKNLSVEIPTSSIKNAFSDIWTALTKGDNKSTTIQGNNAILSQEASSSFLF
jgi:hypothetical protein